MFVKAPLTADAIANGIRGDGCGCGAALALVAVIKRGFRSRSNPRKPTPQRRRPQILIEDGNGRMVAEIPATEEIAKVVVDFDHGRCIPTVLVADIPEEFLAPHAEPVVAHDHVEAGIHMDEGEREIREIEGGQS